MRTPSQPSQSQSTFPRLGVHWDGFFVNAMVAISRGFASPPDFKLTRLGLAFHPHPHPCTATNAGRLRDLRKRRRRLSLPRADPPAVTLITCCCSDPVVPILSGKTVDKADDRRFDSKKRAHRAAGVQASAALPFFASSSSSSPAQYVTFSIFNFQFMREFTSIPFCLF